MKTKNQKTNGGLLKRNSNCFMSAIVAAIIMLFVYAVWEFFPFGDNIILRMDLYHQYAPLFAELYERIFGGHTLLYSFTSGLGSSFLGNYFNYLSSPSMLFVLIFGHANVPEAVAAMVLVKASVSAYTFTYFLGKYSKKSNVSTAAFGILYAFCGYFVAYYWNVMWLDAMVMFPIVILGIYYIIEKGKSLPYILSLTYIMLTNYYMAFMVCMLSVIFFLYFYFSERTISCKLNKDIILKEKYKNTFVTKALNSSFLVRGATFAGASILAAAIAAIALLPVYFILQNSSATSSSFPNSFSSYFTIFDFLANHLAGVEPTIRSSGDTVYPNIYCGIITLVLVPLFMFSNKFSIKEKISTSVVLGVFFFSFNINFLNYIWHGFHFPNDLPYRFSFAYSFFLLFIAYRVFTSIERISAKAILGSAISVAAFAVIVEKVGSANVDLTVVWTSVIFAAVYAVILIFVKNPKYSKTSISILLITAVCAEILIADTGNYKVTQTKDSYTSSYDDTKNVIDYVNNTEGEDGFYRMELATLLTRMDNCWFFYDGVSTFTSMAYQDVAGLQNYLGLYGNRINSYTYNCQTGLYNSMMSLKYIVDNHSYVGTDSYVPQLDDNFLYTKVYNYNDMSVYKNNYWLPVAFSVNEDMDNSWKCDSGNPFAVQNDFWYNASGIADIMKPLNGTLSDRNNIDEITDDQINSGIFNIYKENTGESSNEMTFVYKVEKTQNIYTYITCPDVDTAMISDGSFVYNQNIDGGSDKAYIVDLGTVEAGKDVFITLSLNDDAASGQMGLYVYGMDKDKFVSAYNSINANGVLNVTENKESYISGTVKLAEGKMLYTSIPYDKGWSVYVDGEKVAEEDICKIGDSLLGVKMASGEHTVEFKFVPRGLVIGSVVTAAGILLLIILLILKKKKKLMFSPAYKTDVLELGRWRDAGAENEIEEEKTKQEEGLLQMIEQVASDDMITSEADGPWATALADAENYAKTQAQAKAQAEEQFEAFETAGASAVPEEESSESEGITSEAELEEFEKATDNLNKHNDPETDSLEKKTKKKRNNVIIFAFFLLIAILAGILIVAFAVNNKNQEQPESIADTTVVAAVETEEEISSDVLTTVVTTGATTETTTVVTTTAAPTTKEVKTSAPATTSPTTKAEKTTASASYDGAYQNYTVKSGDNYYSILRSFGISDTPANVQKLCELNGISVNSGLSVGQIIKVPTE